VLVDGYVWLGGARPGLGARLFAALGERTPVVGVAKTAWGGTVAPAIAQDDPHRSVPVLRGQSVKPLFVTAEGLDVAEAAARVSAMHGAHRIPTLLKEVDRLVRHEAAKRATP
jgi:deoxyribonuclease V